MNSLPQKMIDTYLERRQADVQTLLKSLSEGTVDDFNRIGHQLVGNAKNFGFDTLEPIAAKMEGLRPEDLKSLGPSLLSEFSDWLDAASRKV